MLLHYTSILSSSKSNHLPPQLKEFTHTKISMLMLKCLFYPLITFCFVTALCWFTCLFGLITVSLCVCMCTLYIFCYSNKEEHLALLISEKNSSKLINFKLASLTIPTFYEFAVWLQHTIIRLAYGDIRQ